MGKVTGTDAFSLGARIGTLSTTPDSFGSYSYKPEVSPAPAPGVLHRALAGMSMEPGRILPSGSAQSITRRRKTIVFVLSQERSTGHGGTLRGSRPLE